MKAFTLLETLISAFIFLTLIFLTGAIVEFGIRSSGTTNLRHNLQSSATRVMLTLQNDLRRSAYATLSLTARKTVSGQERDGICMATMSDWNDPAGFNTTYGTAAYDRYVGYYATVTYMLSPFFQSDWAFLGWGRDWALPVLPYIPWVKRQMLMTVCGLKGGYLRGEIEV